MEYTILILGILFIFKDEIKNLINPKEEITELQESEERKKLKEEQEKLKKLMSYNIDVAINSKKG